MEQQLCVLACSMFGDVGALVLTVIAVAWGAYQRRGRNQVKRENVSLAEEKHRIEAERDAFKELSLRPPPGPLYLPINLPESAYRAAAATPVPPSQLDVNPPTDDDTLPDEERK